MTYKLQLQPSPPKIFIGIPIGWTKEYALLYMLASLRSLDYNPNYLKAVFSITNLNDRDSEDFIKRTKKLIKNANFPYAIEVITTTPSKKDHERWQVYALVMKNNQALIKKFLRESYDYFLLLGGDNPPLTQTINRLLKLNADVASALLYQRPLKDFIIHGAWPLVFRHVWNLKHLENNGLNEEQKRLLTKAWVNLGFMKPVCLEKNWRKYETLRNVAFGDACCLIKREVLEKVPYNFTIMNYQSPDIQFIQECLGAGFETAVDMKLHCPHLCLDGKAY